MSELHADLSQIEIQRAVGLTQSDSRYGKSKQVRVCERVCLCVSVCFYVCDFVWQVET